MDYDMVHGSLFAFFFLFLLEGGGGRHLDDCATTVSVAPSAAIAEASEDPGEDEDHSKDDEDMLKCTSALKRE